MTDVLLTVGTRKGLFIGPQARRRLGVRRGPHFNAQAVYSVAIDTRARRAPAAGRRRQRALGPLGVPLRRPRARPGPSPPQPAVKFPKDTGASLERVWQLHPAGPPRRTWCTRARSRPRCSAPRTAARPSSWYGRCGSTRPASKWVPGGGGEGLHTVVTDPRDARRGDGRRLHRRGVPHRGRRRELGARPTTGCRRCSCRTRTRSSASACTRSRRTRSTRTGCICRTTGACTAATTRARTGRTSARACPPTSASRWPPIRTAADTAYVFPINADADRVPADHRCRVFRTADAGRSWEPLSAGLPDGGPLRHGAARRAVHGRRRPGGRVLRQPQRRGVRERRRRRQLAAVRLASAGRAVRAGGGRSADTETKGEQALDGLPHLLLPADAGQ